MSKSMYAALLLVGGGLAATGVYAQHHGHSAHKGHAASSAADTRIRVELPAGLASHMLANMRDHLVALGEINEHLALRHFDVAARISEQRLGMSSMHAHGAHEVSKYMPQGMRDAGVSMHRAASQFAIEAQNAGATGDFKPALRMLGEVIGACAGCHAGYRLH